jgi:phosphoserine aminotransferase
MTVFNFSAGPSTLPSAALREAQEELVEYAGSGMSLIEMSHRGPEYTAVHEGAIALARTVFRVPDDFSVLFLQGGATLQFSMVPMNLLGAGRSGGYVMSGAWAKKALADARLYGETYVAWDGSASSFDHMPDSREISLEAGTRYLHVTSNETIDGIQIFDWPDVGVPLVGDMSSDVMSRPIPWQLFDLVYAGAQKNLGPAGASIVFVRDSALESTNRDIGAYLRYDLHRDGNSLFNTPPVFSVWLIGKVLKLLADQGGLDAVEAAGRDKAALLYDAIDSSSGFYTSPVQVESRSLMNVVFGLSSEELESKFLGVCANAQLHGLKGHRSVGGVRASIYNAMPLSGVEALVSVMSRFRAENG